MSQVPPDARARSTAAVCEYRAIDPAGVAALGTMLTSSSDLQACIVHALREIHTKEAVPFLEKSLNSNVPGVRYDAVIGIAQFAMSFSVATSSQKPNAIAAFTRQLGVTDTMVQNYPAMGAFAADEQRYISYWKTWLSTHGPQ